MCRGNIKHSNNARKGYRALTYRMIHELHQLQQPERALQIPVLCGQDKDWCFQMANSGRDGDIEKAHTNSQLNLALKLAISIRILRCASNGNVMFRKGVREYHETQQTER
jgi:hypothetical protein